MMDGRRHSVDIPISKTLIALRRVRSLRDPSTNSLSKLSAYVDNLNWETNSNNNILLEHVSGCLDNNGTLGPKDLGLYGQRGDHVTDYAMYYGPGKHTSKLGLSKNSGWAGCVPERTLQVEESTLLRSNQAKGCENKSLTARYCNIYGNKELDLTCMTPTSEYMEGVDSCNEPIEGSIKVERLVDHYSSKRKSRHRKHIIRSSKVAGGDVMSRVSSPCLSMRSSCGTSLYGNDDVDAVDSDHRGCGIGYCWSRTPRFRGSNLSSDVEEQHLLSGEDGVSPLAGQRKDSKHIENETIPYSESPRSLNQKFRPKSFHELVGQNAVTKSLSSAISSRRITPLYLFHGPRGTGKTSASRIFAAALNCLSLEENKPCGLCQECALFFSGRSRDVKEVDSVSINRARRVRYLIKNAMLPPVSSSFKVFIIDECQLMRESTWATLLNSLEELSRHTIFIMITPDLSKLPRSAVLRTQKFHFPKIKEADIVDKLAKICIEEGFDYDLVALDFIATKSNGSLRDAEMTLEQLSLLGKRITMSLTYEFIGIVSDDELLELLALALSSDNSNTVRMARELMRSRIDPMQLISQLANLIMDILAGKCQEGTSEVKKQFFERHTSEADLQQLNNALKILSETEKQLRSSKNQTTWLTVALLQLSSAGSSICNANDSSLCVRTVHPRESTDGEFCSTSSIGESLKHLVRCPCDHNDACQPGIQDDNGTLESIWSRATELCESISLRNFLRKRGSLVSVCFHKGLAVVELEFHHPDYVCKAEKSWKMTASALQATLGCNVEIRIYLAHCGSVRKYAKVKKPSFSLFSCSRRMGHESSTEHENDLSENYNVTYEQQKVKDKSVDIISSDGGSQVSHICCQIKEPVRTIRNSDGNALSIGLTDSDSLVPDNIAKQHGLGVDSSKEEERYCQCHDLSAQAPEKQPSCFPRSVKLHKRLHSSDTSPVACLRSEPQNNLALSVPSMTSSETCFCTGDPYTIGRICKKYTNCRGVDRQRKDSKVHCWRTPTFPFKKAWQLRHQSQGAQLVEWVLTCATAK